MPVIAVFASTALMALAIVLNLYDGLPVLTWLKWFFATSMVALAIQKLQDVGGFVNGFLGYDLLAQRICPLRLCLSVRRALRGCRHVGPDRPRQPINLARRPGRYLHRIDRWMERLQGRLHRQTLTNLRLRRRRIERASRVHLSYGEPGDAGHGNLDACRTGIEVVRTWQNCV